MSMNDSFSTYDSNTIIMNNITGSCGGVGTATGDRYEYTSNEHLFRRSVSWLDNETDYNDYQDKLYDNCKYDNIDDDNNNNKYDNDNEVDVSTSDKYNVDDVNDDDDDDSDYQYNHYEMKNDMIEQQVQQQQSPIILSANDPIVRKVKFDLDRNTKSDDKINTSIQNKPTKWYDTTRTNATIDDDFDKNIQLELDLFRKELYQITNNIPITKPYSQVHLQQEQSTSDNSNGNNNDNNNNNNSTIIQGRDGNLINLNELFEKARRQQQQVRKQQSDTSNVIRLNDNSNNNVNIGTSTDIVNVVNNNPNNNNSSNNHSNDENGSQVDNNSTRNSGTSTTSSPSRLSGTTQQSSNPPTPVQTPADLKTYIIYDTNNTHKHIDVDGSLDDDNYDYDNSDVLVPERFHSTTDTLRRSIYSDSTRQHHRRYNPTKRTVNIGCNNRDDNHKEQDDEENEQKIEVDDKVIDSNANGPITNDDRTNRIIDKQVMENILDDMRLLIEQQNHRIERLEEENQYLRSIVFDRQQQQQQQSQQDQIPSQTTRRTRMQQPPPAQAADSDTNRTRLHMLRNTTPSINTGQNDNDDNENNSQCPSTPSIQLPSPPPVSLSSRISQQSDRERRHQRSRRYVDYEHLLRNSDDHYQHRQQTLLPLYSSSSSSSAVGFSPGTQFVEELSRVVDIRRGHYAPLSIIMDKHLAKVDALNRSSSSRSRYR